MRPVKAGLGVVVLVLTLVSCDVLFDEEPLRVVDTAGDPVTNAILGYRVDGYVESARPDPDGVIRVAEERFGQPAWLVATGKVGQYLTPLERSTYTLRATDRVYRPQGEIEGLPIRAGGGVLHTVSGNGDVRRYRYVPGPVALESETLPFAVGSHARHWLDGDTLWLVASRTGEPLALARTYLLHDDAPAERLGSFDAPHADWIVRRDSLLVLGRPDVDSVQVFVASITGLGPELAAFELDVAWQAFLFGDLLVARLADEAGFRAAIIDLAAAGGPEVVDTLDPAAFPAAAAVQHGDTLILVPDMYGMGGFVDGPVPVPMTPPAMPPGGPHRLVHFGPGGVYADQGDVRVDAWVTASVGPGLVVGYVPQRHDFRWPGSTALIDVDAGWEIVSTFAEQPLPARIHGALGDHPFLFLSTGSTGRAYVLHMAPD